MANDVGFAGIVCCQFFWGGSIIHSVGEVRKYSLRSRGTAAFHWVARADGTYDNDPSETRASLAHLTF